MTEKIINFARENILQLHEYGKGVLTPFYYSIRYRTHWHFVGHCTLYRAIHTCCLLYERIISSDTNSCSQISVFVNQSCHSISSVFTIVFGSCTAAS